MEDTVITLAAVGGPGDYRTVHTVLLYLVVSCRWLEVGGITDRDRVEPIKTRACGVMNSELPSRWVKTPN